MKVLGEIIKTIIEAADQIIATPDPVKSQEKVLGELLEKAEDTSFGKYYEFSKIGSSDDIRTAFADKVPFHSYDQMREKWWQRVIDGAEDITWPGRVEYFAVSSGTTSSRKHIPVTSDMLISIRRAGMQQLKGVADFDLPAKFFEKEILLFGSSTNLKKVNDHYEGEISGISALQLPFWVEGYYRPGKEIAFIDNWDDRVEALAKEAPNWDIGTISGIPSWIELMLKKVIEYHKLKNIHEIWPDFTVFTSGGVAFDPYKKSFEKVCGKPIIVIDTYLASEGYLATQIRKDTDAMALITNNGVYFEFIPFLPENMDEDGSIKQGTRALKIEEVEEGVDYVLVISTSAGAWRYMIGDTVLFTDKSRAEIKITGRTKHFLNVVGSQLSVIQMNHAMEQLNHDGKIDVMEFTVAAVMEDDNYMHRWYLGVGDADTGLNDEELAQKIDAYLKDNNKNYKVARSKALKSVEVKTIPVDIFQKWAEDTNHKGGQVKVPRVMKEEDFREWEEYVQKNL